MDEKPFHDTVILKHQADPDYQELVVLEDGEGCWTSFFTNASASHVEKLAVEEKTSPDPAQRALCFSAGVRLTDMQHLCLWSGQGVCVETEAV